MQLHGQIVDMPHSGDVDRPAFRPQEVLPGLVEGELDLVSHGGLEDGVALVADIVEDDEVGAAAHAASQDPGRHHAGVLGEALALDEQLPPGPRSFLVRPEVGEDQPHSAIVVDMPLDLGDDVAGELGRGRHHLHP